VLCFVPTLWLIVALFLSLVIILGLLLIVRSSLYDAFQSHPALSYVLVGMFSVLGTWAAANLLVPLHILRELFCPIRPKTRDQLREDVILLQSCISFLDAFDASQQTRLVIILDALESIYESDRLVGFLEAINMHYLSTKSSVCPTSPFVILLSLDPHHHVTGKSKQYLKTIVHLPFFLQNSQLRRVKIAQQVEPQSFSASVALAHSGSIKFGTSSMQKNRPKRGTQQSF
jgi:ankyrin repeat-rich membrane spanning protein